MCREEEIKVSSKYHIETMKYVVGRSKQQDVAQLTKKSVMKRKKCCHICSSKISKTSKKCFDKCNLNICSEHYIKKIVRRI